MPDLYSEGIEYEFLAMVSKLNTITMSALAALLPIAKRLQFFAQYGTREIFSELGNLKKSQSAIRSALLIFFLVQMQCTSHILARVCDRACVVKSSS